MRILIVAALLVAACGSATPASTSGVPSGPTAVPPTAEPTPTPETPASLAPGAIQFRVVNLYRDDSGTEAPVDVYARTQGLVQALMLQTALGYGEATDYFAPPDPGSVVVTTADAGDPTCVINCPHFILESSTTFGEGDARTIIVYDEGSFELWHNPEPASVGTTGNALAPADPSAALLFVVPVALIGADFGLRLGFAGEAGCQVDRTSGGVLVGGNQVALFDFDGAAEALLYDTRDTECTGEPVGGPFAVSGANGSRTVLVLHGQPNEMEGLVLDV